MYKCKLVELCANIREDNANAVSVNLNANEINSEKKMDDTTERNDGAQT